MVRVYGAQLADLSDRAARQVGLIYGMRMKDGTSCAPHIAWHDHINVQDSPWWARYPWGRMTVLDDFEGTLKWRQNSGTVSKASDARFVHDGTSSMKMVTGAVAGNLAQAELWSEPVDRWGTYVTLGFYWTINAAADATPRDFFFTWLVDDINFNATYTFGMRFLNYNATVQQRKLQYMDNTGSWVDLAGGSYRVRITEPQFNFWIITLQKVAGTGYAYRAFQMNETAWNMNLAGGLVGARSIAGNDIVVTCTTDVAAATTAYVDDFFLMDDTLLHYWTQWGF